MTSTNCNHNTHRLSYNCSTTEIFEHKNFYNYPLFLDNAVCLGFGLSQIFEAPDLCSEDGHPSLRPGVKAKTKPKLAPRRLELLGGVTYLQKLCLH